MRIHPFPPTLIRVTDKGLKDYGNGSMQVGTARLFLVTIRPGFEGDAGLLAHELFHVWRWWLIGLLAVALLALAGWQIGTVDIAGIAFPAWSFAPAGMAANPLLYANWPEWRLAEEVAAYRAQLRVNAATGFDGGKDYSERYAGFIARNYGLDVIPSEALQRLRSKK